MDQFESDLKKKIYETVKGTKERKICVSFSGGLDSSLLAKVCRDLKKDVTLLTVGFPQAADLNYVKKVSSQLKLPLLVKKLNIEELEKDIGKMISWVKFPNIIELEISLAHFYSFLLAHENNIDRVLTANGLDALFCGFDKYRNIIEEGNEKLQETQEEDVKHALENEKKYEKIASSLKIKKVSPFLDLEFVRFVLTIPFNLKIKGPDDNLRKHILRKVALDIGLPKIAALRPKKAVQYSSKIDWAMEKLAKAHGITKEMAKSKGFKGIKEAYLKLYLA
mgnify:CR=1 FL=1